MIDILAIELYIGQTNILLSAILIVQLKVLHPKSMQVYLLSEYALPSLKAI